jgi:hypothetical protein
MYTVVCCLLILIRTIKMYQRALIKDIKLRHGALLALIPLALSFIPAWLIGFEFKSYDFWIFGLCIGIIEVFFGAFIGLGIGKPEMDSSH